MKIIDTHCHLDDVALALHLRENIELWKEAGLSYFFLPGICAKNWNRILNLSHQFPEIKAGLGIHPLFIEEHDLHDLEQLKNLLKLEKVSFIGEIGLDFFTSRLLQKEQEDFFTQQLKLAQQCKKPVILHVRSGHNEVLKIIKDNNFTQRGIVHAYSGTQEEAKRYLDLGFKLGLGGTLTRPNAHKLQSIAQNLPLDSFVLETDAPDMPPYKYTHPNTPNNIVVVWNKLAELRSCSLEEVADVSTRAVMEIFPHEFF